MHWSERWLGKPYAVLGRGPDAFDCLGLFMAVQNAEFGLSLDYGLAPLVSSAPGARSGSHGRVTRS